MFFSKSSIKMIALSLAILFFTHSLYAQEPEPTPEQTPAAQTEDDTTIPVCKPGGGSRTEQLLTCIQLYTNGILKKTNQLPSYIKAATAFFLLWTNTDESKKSIIPELQGNLTNYSNEFTNLKNGQADLQKNLVTDFFKDPSDPTGKTPVTKEKLMNANDLDYQYLLGIPVFNPDPRKEADPTVDPARNYMLNASGLTIQHLIPNPAWRPQEDIQRQRYFSYYNTVSAVQTYNGYMLSELYADYQKKFALTEAQKTLVKQVSGPNWMTQVGSDNLGLILRHLLMFDSQIFVLLTRMLEAERQMLIAQTMTNTLLIAVNLGNEDTLVKKANGTLSIP